jgi:hypothetical protein
LKEAHKAAKALAKVVETSRKVVINGQIYLTYEHWQTETPTAEDDRCYDRAKGWTESTSHAAALDINSRLFCVLPGARLIASTPRPIALRTFPTLNVLLNALPGKNSRRPTWHDYDHRGQSQSGRFLEYYELSAEPTYLG